MAAMETAAPVIRTINIKANGRHPRSLDPVVLSRKLEAAKREQEAANTRRERRQATRNGTFIARSATHSSDSSSTPPLSPFNTAKPAETKFLTRDPPSAAAHQSEWCTADGRPVMTHKSMFAALNLGLADLEAMTEKLELETSKQREYFCSRCKTPDVPGQHNHDDTESHNYSRRRSLPALSHLSAAKHGSQTAYERVDIPTDAPPQYHAISYRASADLPRNSNQRPTLQSHDRPDWSQQSQHGGDTSTRANLFDVPSGYVFRRRTQPHVAPVRNSNVPVAPIKESHLISDAVKLIKASERRAKRKSIWSSPLALLKKL